MAGRPWLGGTVLRQVLVELLDDLSIAKTMTDVNLAAGEAKQKLCGEWHDSFGPVVGQAKVEATKAT